MPTVQFAMPALVGNGIGVSNVFNARTDFGARGDGVTDDTGALRNAYAAAELVNGAVFLPPGIYRYSSKPFNILNRTAVIGAGKRQTFLKPMPGYTDYAITIKNAWRNGTESAGAGSTTLDFAQSKAGVLLQGFSIVGDRAVGPSHGIATIGTVDFMQIRDMDFITIDGTALQLGVQDDGFSSCIRECFFENIMVSLCGNLSEPALDIGGGAGGSLGDGTNDCSFLHMNLSNNKGVHMRILETISAASIRGLQFYGLVVNGDGPEASSPTPANLIEITGLVGGITIHGMFMSGSTEVAGVKYGGVVISDNASGTPDRIKIHGDIVSMHGHGYVINKIASGEICGTSAMGAGSDMELKIAAGGITSNLKYDVISQQSVATRNSIIEIGDEAAASRLYGAFRDGTELTAVDDATPDVKIASRLLLAGTGPLSITDFDNGGRGQLLTVVCADSDVGPTTLVNGSGLVMRARQNRIIHPGQTVQFKHNGATQWLEVGDGPMQVVDGWTQDNVAASQTNVELTRAVGRFRAVRAGALTGLVVTSTEARTAGTLTVKVFKNTGLAGAAGSQLGTLQAVLDGTNTIEHASTQKPQGNGFAAGDELYITVTTDGSWTPTTADIRCALEIMT